MKKSYSDKLKDVRWQQKRLELLNAAGWKCCDCHQSKDVTLHVHHNYYRRNTDPWDYPNDCYTVLCENCHKDREQVRQVIVERLFTFPLDFQYTIDNLLLELDPRGGTRPEIIRSTLLLFELQSIIHQAYTPAIPTAQPKRDRLRQIWENFLHQINEETRLVDTFDSERGGNA